MPIPYQMYILSSYLFEKITSIYFTEIWFIRKWFVENLIVNWEHSNNPMKICQMPNHSWNKYFVIHHFLSTLNSMKMKFSYEMPKLHKNEKFNSKCEPEIHMNKDGRPYLHLMRCFQWLHSKENSHLLSRLCDTKHRRNVWLYWCFSGKRCVDKPFWNGLANRKFYQENRTRKFAWCCCCCCCCADVFLIVNKSITEWTESHRTNDLFIVLTADFHEIFIFTSCFLYCT